MYIIYPYLKAEVNSKLDILKLIRDFRVLVLREWTVYSISVIP
jgi:hypothetical protein